MQIFSKVAIALAVVATIVMLVSGIALERLASTRQQELRRASVDALELLAVAVAPAVAHGRHDRAQGVLDNVANFPERFPQVQSLAVIDTDGRVIADLDPQRYNTQVSEPENEAALTATAPIIRELAGGHLLVVVPLRLSHPLGALRAELNEQHSLGLLHELQLYAALLLFAIIVLVGLSLILVQRLERQAITDPLTQLPNRRYFNEHAHRAVARARRYRRKLSLVMLDLDQFKAINDKFRHSTGDSVLQGVATILQDTARKADLVARWGGEELVILMPETGLKAASHAAERMRKAMKDARLLPETEHWPVTASFGVAELDDRSMDVDEALNQLLSAADGAMYAAKDAGRDCVFIVTPAGHRLWPERAEENG